MGKPRMIILIRHAQSEGNKNKDIHQTVPDHRVKLTPEGWAQAQEAGRRLRTLLRADDTLHFFTSPYRRTRETTEGILSTLTSSDPEPSPFSRTAIKVYEEPRLREQDFGNFQQCSAEMERMWQERADYGHFFYRIPDGESAADAYDRISGFNESLWRQFGEDDFASVCVLVTHGLMSRVFLMKWYHFSVEYFEDLRNVNHCEFVVMNRSDTGKYVLENKLRTWSQLKRERAGKMAQLRLAGTQSSAGREPQDMDKESVNPQISQDSQFVSPIPKRKQWGGCPSGCSHVNSYRPKTSNLVAGVLSDVNNSSSPNDKEPATMSSEPVASFSPRRPTGRFEGPSLSDEDAIAIGAKRGRLRSPQRTSIIQPADGAVSRTYGTPSHSSVEDRLAALATDPGSTQIKHVWDHDNHIGRDGGGSDSEHASELDGDVEGEADGGKERPKRLPSRLRKEFKPVVAAVEALRLGERCRNEDRKRDESGMGRNIRADALGDASETDSCDDEDGHAGDEHEDEDYEHTTNSIY